MKQQSDPCEHRWRYYVNLESRAVRLRQCERCQRRAIVSSGATLTVDREPQKLSA